MIATAARPRASSTKLSLVSFSPLGNVCFRADIHDLHQLIVTQFGTDLNDDLIERTVRIRAEHGLSSGHRAR